MAGIPPLPATTPKPDRYGSGFDAWYDPDSNWSSGVPSDNGYAPDGSREGNIDGDVSGSDSSVETLKPHIELELGDKGNGETDEDMGRIGFLGPTRTAPEGRKTTETDVGTTTEVTPTASPTETGTSIQLSTDPVNSKSSATVSTLPTPSTPSSAATVAESEMTSGLLPAWAIVLIAIGAVMFLIFAVSLVVFCMKERQRKRQSGEGADYGRAARRALAAATGVAFPLWIARRVRSRTAGHGPVRCGGGHRGGPSEDEKEAWFEKRLQMDMEWQDAESRETLTPPGATGPASSSASPSPPPLSDAPQRTPSMSSTVSSMSSDGSVNGDYVRVQINQPQEYPTR